MIVKDEPLKNDEHYEVHKCLYFIYADSDIHKATVNITRTDKNPVTNTPRT